MADSDAMMIRYCGISGCDRSMKLGTTAAMNTVPFGLVALIAQPRTISCLRVRTGASVAATSGLSLARHCEMPIHTR